MGMIKCTECGKEMSDKASVCPNCGCPIEDIKAKILMLSKEKNIYEELVEKGYKQYKTMANHCILKLDNYISFIVSHDV